MDRLKDKVAIVTGSTSGIGTGIAKMYGAEGAKVVVCGRREERGQAVVDAIAEAGGEATFHFLDITKSETVDALFADTEAAYGKIDILVNNAAGMALKDGRVDEISLEEWDAVFASDIRSTFYCTKVALPYLQKNGGGSIINIGSMASCSGDLGTTAYACAKAGVEMLTQYTALQYGKQDIRCNCVRPGLIVTPENESKVPDALKQIFLDNIEVTRYGSPRTSPQCASTSALTKVPTSPVRSSPSMAASTRMCPRWRSSAPWHRAPGRKHLAARMTMTCGPRGILRLAFE